MIPQPYAWYVSRTGVLTERNALSEGTPDAPSQSDRLGLRAFHRQRSPSALAALGSQRRKLSAVSTSAAP